MLHIQMLLNHAAPQTWPADQSHITATQHNQRSKQAVPLRRNSAHMQRTTQALKHPYHVFSGDVVAMDLLQLSSLRYKITHSVTAWQQDSCFHVWWIAEQVSPFGQWNGYKKSLPLHVQRPTDTLSFCILFQTSHDQSN